MVKLAIKSQGPNETESDRDNAGFINYMAKLLSWGGPKWKQRRRWMTRVTRGFWLKNIETCVLQYKESRPFLVLIVFKGAWKKADTHTAWFDRHRRVKMRRKMTFRKSKNRCQ